jgi:LMBR1 domain-containing protein 1
MVDVFLIVISSIIAAGLIGLNIYLLIYYSHPDDKTNCTAWVAKVFVVFGMTLSWMQVLMLPLDVANNS